MEVNLQLPEHVSSVFLKIRIWESECGRLFIASNAMHLFPRNDLKALVETGTLGDCFFFSRAGWNGMRASSTVAWAGDQNVDFSYGDGLFTTIPAALRYLRRIFLRVH